MCSRRMALPRFAGCSCWAMVYNGIPAAGQKVVLDAANFLAKNVCCHKIATKCFFIMCSGREIGYKFGRPTCESQQLTSREVGVAEVGPSAGKIDRDLRKVTESDLGLKIDYCEEAS
ncbi:NADH-quinone oxidoreductase subunit N [Striga asiatica]|uniref:NADH-quinone oxidoreductase subunit N n=1 Tax=Striga asiatica TaxID=4170 RepID=A0A5A7QW90_STRAF|nr:NADH-quinone oxidoreductase subunit N [Striga asiatica]